MQDSLAKVIGDMQRDIMNCDDTRFKSMEEKQSDKLIAETLRAYINRLERIHGDLTDKK